MTWRGLLFLLFMVCGLSVDAVLPRDAQFRQKDVFDYRQRKLAEYEQAQKQHEMLMVDRAGNVRQMMAASPWGESGTRITGVRQTGLTGGIQTNPVRRVRKWTFGLIALLFIGGLVWWIRYATGKELDGQ